MRGDPREFPHEIRNLTSKSCNLILMPWRVSLYVERLFWGSMRSLTSPIALIVMLDTNLTPTIADIATGAGGGTGMEREVRNRSQSAAAARSRALSSVSDPDGSASSYPGDCRGRSDSILASTVPTSGGVSMSSPQYSPAPSSAVQGSLMRLLSGHDTAHLEENTPQPLPTVETGRQSVCIRSMVCVITGSSMCQALLPLALRLAEKMSLQVTVLVAAEISELPDCLLGALAVFKKAAEFIRNIKIEYMSISCKDVDSIVSHCADRMYDLIAFGYRDYGGEGGGESSEDLIPPPLGRVHRSSSISFATSAPDSSGKIFSSLSPSLSTSLSFYLS